MSAYARSLFLMLALGLSGCATNRVVKVPPAPMPPVVMERGVKASVQSWDEPPAWKTNRVVMEFTYPAVVASGQSFAIERQSALGTNWETVVTVTFTDTNTLSIYRVRQ